MMKADVYWIDGLPKGRLGIAARPRGGDWLDDEIQALREAGIDVLVSMLTPEEAAEFHLDGESAACQRQGIAFRSLPIPDRGVPRSAEALGHLVAALCRELEFGKGIAVHCRQGIGRSSLVVAAVLIASGDSPDRAWKRVQGARGRPVPDTDEQRSWVAQFAETRSSKTPKPRRGRGFPVRRT